MPSTAAAPKTRNQCEASSVACISCSLSHSVTTSTLPFCVLARSKPPLKPGCILSAGRRCSSTSPRSCWRRSESTEYWLTRANITLPPFLLDTCDSVIPCVLFRLLVAQVPALNGRRFHAFLSSFLLLTLAKLCQLRLIFARE